MVSPTDALLSSAGGDFFLTLFAIMVIFIIYQAYRTPKEWEAATDRLISKMCEVIKEQRDLKDCYKEHDTQAKEIKQDIKAINQKLEDRPCIKVK